MELVSSLPSPMPCWLGKMYILQLVPFISRGAGRKCYRLMIVIRQDKLASIFPFFFETQLHFRSIPSYNLPGGATFISALVNGPGNIGQAMAATGSAPTFCMVIIAVY